MLTEVEGAGEGVERLQIGSCDATATDAAATTGTSQCSQLRLALGGTQRGETQTQTHVVAARRRCCVVMVQAASARRGCSGRTSTPCTQQLILALLALQLKAENLQRAANRHTHNV